MKHSIDNIFNSQFSNGLLHSPEADVNDVKNGQVKQKHCVDVLRP
jgi:hypothetical protein